MRIQLSRSGLITIVAVAFCAVADASPHSRPKPATRADIDRLEQQIALQRKVIESLVKIQKEYAASLADLMSDPNAATTSEPKPDAKPTAAKPDALKPEAVKPEPAKLDAKPVKLIKREPTVKPTGIVAGRVTGASDVYVYVEDVVASAPGAATATMKQDGKQFVPRVLVVQKGTQVDFPNRDAIFHNVFSITPESSFDLGSYPQGEFRSAKMSRPGVVNVYCNMHSQMVGYILVVPGSYFVRAAADGSFRLPAPTGHHRIVAWAPNAKPVVTEVDVGDEPVTLQLKLKQGPAPAHTQKDGFPYGSYKE